MVKRSRLTLTSDGERAFAHLADDLAAGLDRILRTHKIKKKELAERANIDQAIVTRVLDGTRNVEIRTVGALYGALGYVVDVSPRSIRGPVDRSNEEVRTTASLTNPDRSVASSAGSVVGVGQNQIVSAGALFRHG